MKRNLLIFLFILIVMPATQANAQNEASIIDSLTIELWPDYDRSSVLVLLTGLLPADTRFPATVIVPLPKNAQLNAVARIDGRDGIMKDDIPTAPGPSDMLMFITTDLQFRVEYYMPYVANGNQRMFDYTWLADIAVNTLQLKVQQPKTATSFNVNPPAIDSITGTDGLTYHAFRPTPVPAGQSFSVHLEYKMPTARLSVTTQPLPRTESIPEDFSQPTIGFRINWAIIVGGLIILIGFIWLIASRRSRIDTHVVQSQNPREMPRIKFCQDCGEPVDKTDKWCGQCGTKL